VPSLFGLDNFVTPLDVITQAGESFRADDMKLKGSKKQKSNSQIQPP
jgi:hypothetical protein